MISNRNIFLLIYIFIPILFFAACNKTTSITPTQNNNITTCDTCLPAITTTGANTFGCRVNGNVWLPKGGSFQPGQTIEYTNKELVISGYNNDREEFLTLDLKPITDTVNYTFYSYLLSTQGASFLNAKTSVDYYADTIYHGKIHLLRFDPIKGFVAGTFEFDVYDKYHQHNNDTIHITDGRFVLHL